MCFKLVLIREGGDTLEFVFVMSHAYLGVIAASSILPDSFWVMLLNGDWPAAEVISAAAAGVLDGGKIGAGVL